MVLYFLRQLLSLGAFQFSNASRGFAAQNTAAPLPADFVVAVREVELDGLDDLGELGLVTGVNLRERENE